MIKVPVTLVIIGLGLALVYTSSFRYRPDPASVPMLIEWDVSPTDTPKYSLIGEWELTDNGVGSGVKLTFDTVQVHWDTLVYSYSIEGDSLRIFTQYVDHIGDGNSHGYIAKLTVDSLVVYWREGDVNTYVKPRRPDR